MSRCGGPPHNRERVFKGEAMDGWRGEEAMKSVEVAFPAVLLLSLLSPSLCSGDGVAVDGAREFDYFLLSLQWPGTFCRRTRHCCPSNGCCKRSVDLEEFTIHGLWPNYNDGTWPACCNNVFYDPKKISPLIGKLSKYWPTLSCSPSSTCHGGKGLFWAHEWEKHGTCSSPVLQDEYSYFSTTLDLYFKYNITKVLTSAGFSSSNDDKYKLAEVSTAIKNATGGTPWLVCSHDFVQELRLCLHKDFSPRDCGVLASNEQGELNSKDSCPMYVRLPKFTRPTESKLKQSTEGEDRQALEVLLL
ncbi:ribonuclease 2 [Wolffia australiana]